MAPQDSNPVAKRINKIKLIFVLAAFLSFLFSVYLYFLSDIKDHRTAGLYVGLWVPSIQSLGTLLLAGETRSR